MSGRDDESCDIIRHHATPCDREQKQVGSGWHKTSFVRRRCRRETRWREWKRKAGRSRKRKRKTSGRRKRKGFPLQRTHPRWCVLCVRCSLCTPPSHRTQKEHTHVGVFFGVQSPFLFTFSYCFIR